MIDYTTVSQSMLIIQQKQVTRKMCSNISDNELLNEAIYQCCQAISEGYEFCQLEQMHGMLLGRKIHEPDESKKEVIEDCREIVRKHSINGYAYSFHSV